MQNKQRITILVNVFISLFLVIIIRLAYIQIVKHKFYLEKSQEQRTRLIKLAAQRGDIFDRDGNILATSIDTYSVYEYKKGWVARMLELREAEKLMSEKPKERSLIKEKKRVYPKTDLLAQVLGFVGIDNQGLSGIELSFDEYLRGSEGQLITEGDTRGRELYGAVRELTAGEDGMNVTLTIDENIQYIAEREITEQIKASHAKSGMCIVMDAENGEILALASKPDFDPNTYRQFDSQLWHPKFLNPYEPGSTFKLIAVACGLEEGVIKPDSQLKKLVTIKVGDKTISNSHSIDEPGGTISVSKVLEKSINTGMVQIGLKLGKEKFYNGIMKFGFGQKTKFGMWGESSGILRNWKYWNVPDIAMMTFGQSIAATPLQVMQATSAFANDGVMLEPILIKKVESQDGNFIKAGAQELERRAVSVKTAKEMKQLMENVVIHGSGRRAKIDKFRVGGKTGTAQKSNPAGGYLKNKYIASFIGFAPLDKPKVLALVIVDEPQGSIWGESVCGPVFSRVVGYTLRYLNAVPDML